MEINKDEAIRCLSIANKHYSSGNYVAAVKFGKKSISLYPTDQAKAFVEKAEKSLASEPPSTGKSTGVHTRQASEPVSEKRYTAEQTQAVREVLSCGTNYYKVLAVERTSSDGQIKKAYRKLALQFHPDKNGAPGADEAFKLISKAFTVLSDPQKRAIHDSGGGDPEQRASQPHPGFSAQRAYSGYREEVSPEELFNMFFGGGNFQRRGAGHRTFNFAQAQAQARQQRQDGTNVAGWIQVLPLLLLFAFTILSAFITSDNSPPLYSFSPSATYSHKRATKSHHVPYYVNPKAFKASEQTRHKLARVEKEVESDWVHNLHQTCQAERRDRANKITMARGVLFGIGRDEKRYQDALKIPTRSCDELKKFGYTSSHY
ncbi:DnaJ domain-containing protein [Phycomyces nitens]|nr:DnaJ domain-containing protein [Phycomyces nitens]